MVETAFVQKSDSSSIKELYLIHQKNFRTVITLLVIIILIGLAVIISGIIGFLPIYPALVLGIPLLATALIGLTIYHFYHKRRQTPSLPDKLPEDKKEPLKIPEFASPIIVDLTVGPTEIQAASIHELHVAVRSLLGDSPRDRNNRILSNTEALDKLRVEILRNSGVSSSIIFTSDYFPGMIFKSKTISKIERSLEASSLSQKIIEDKKLNLLRIPKAFHEKNSVVKRSRGENFGLLIEEYLPVKYTQLLPFFLKKDDLEVIEEVKSEIPALCQLLEFVNLTLFYSSSDNLPILEEKGGNGEAVIGLVNLRNIQILSGDKPINKERLLQYWMDNKLRADSLDQIGLLKKLREVCYRICPTMRNFLEKKRV